MSCDSNKQTISSYEENADRLAEKYNGLGARDDDVEQVLSLVGDTPFVVELGCGNGRDAQVFLEHTESYVGVDACEAFIERARENAPRGDFVVEDVAEYEFPDGVDAVVAFASLLHLDKDCVRRVLRRAHESLRSNGVVYISLKKGLYNEEGDTVTDKYGTRTFYYYTPGLIKDLAEGYETVFVSEQSFNGQDWFTLVLRR